MILQSKILLAGLRNEQMCAIGEAVVTGGDPVPLGCHRVEASQVLQHEDGAEGWAAGCRGHG